MSYDDHLDKQRSKAYDLPKGQTTCDMCNKVMSEGDLLNIEDLIDGAEDATGSIRWKIELHIEACLEKLGITFIDEICEDCAEKLSL